MTNTSLKELFPSKFSFFIFVFYIFLFVNQGILVTISQELDNAYNYNVITVVLFTEVLKLIISSALYCNKHTAKELIAEVIKYRQVLYLYFVPAFLYCLYNNLSFLNLSLFDPTTYYLLLQFRVVVTGILFQVIFKKVLSKKQWLSLLLLTFGCMLKQVNFTEESPLNKSTSIQLLGINTFYILIQIICSCLAGVYNEYLLKNEGANINIYVQNVFMYLDSIICNLGLLMCNGNVMSAFEYESIMKVFHYKVLLVMFNNAAIGICTSFFLKTLNSILKTFASALELVLTALLSYIVLSIPIYLNTILALAIVLYATYLYSQSPVQNVSKTDKLNMEEEELLQMEEV